MSISRVAIAVFLLLLLFTSYLMIELFWAFITPIVLALVLISIFYPFYKRMLSIFRGRKYIAAAMVMIVIILGVSIPFSLFIGSLTKQALYLYESRGTEVFFGDFLSKFSSHHPVIAQIHNMAASMGIDISAEKMVGALTQLVSSFGRMLYDNLSELASNALSIAFNFILTMLLVYTFFITGEELKQYVMDLSPLPNDEKERLVRQFSEISRAVFVSNGVVSVAEGLFGGFGIYWFGLGHGLFWGVVIAFSAFLPVVGAWIVIGPAAFILLMEGDVGFAVIYLIYNAIYLSILELVVKPRMIGGKNRLHIILVLLSVLGGIKLFGVLGIFYGPLVVTMFLSLIEIYKEHYREHLLKFDNKV